MSPDKCGSGAGKTGVIFLFSCPGTDWLCPSQPIRLSLCVLHLADRRHTARSFFLSLFLSLCNHLRSHPHLNYDSWSFTFNHKNQPLRLVLDFLY